MNGHNAVWRKTFRGTFAHWCAMKCITGMIACHENEQRSERLHDGCRNASLTFWLTYARISGFGVGKFGRSVGRVPDLLVLRTDSCLKVGGRSSPEAAGKRRRDPYWLGNLCRAQKIPTANPPTNCPPSIIPISTTATDRRIYPSINVTVFTVSHPSSSLGYGETGNVVLISTIQSGSPR